MRNSRSRVLRLALLIALLAGVAGVTADLARAGTEPIWPTQQWQASSPEEQGMDSAALARLIDFGQTRNLDSLLIVRHGKMVLDAYYAPYTADIPHAVNSVTKAVVGTLAAIALKEGVLDSTSHPVLGYFGDRTIENADDRKRTITLQHLLDMTSGLAWTEPLTDNRFESVVEMERSPNWVKFVLDRPMARTPGESFDYNSGNPHLLSALLTKVTGMSAEDYARTKLFGPLGIGKWQWRRDPRGISTGGYGLALLPHDMAKLGYLYLRRGEWEGKSLVSAEWIDKVNHASVDMNTTFDPTLRYSNFFWARPDNQVYFANGYHCQMILVYPALDNVAVTTARGDCAARRLATYIADAARSATALPPDPNGANLLASTVRDIAVEKPTEHDRTSPLALTVSGKAYHFQRNALLVKSLSLTLDNPRPRYELELYNLNPKNPPIMLTGPIGLDGVYRSGPPTPMGVNAAKANWLNDHTLVINSLIVGGSNPAQRWTLWFDGDKLNLRGSLDGRAVSIDSDPGG
jgi:CubicO group peptidase (beta-lactamase class C family)